MGPTPALLFDLDDSVCCQPTSAARRQLSIWCDLQGIKDNESQLKRWGYLLSFQNHSLCFSAAVCGLAGALFANWQEYVSPDISIGRVQAN